MWSLLKQSGSGAPAIGKAIVVCPSSLVGNWRKEFKTWLGDERCRPSVVNVQGNDAATIIRDFINGR